jgi:GH24 family phage-related lysozyme (muramidase)
METIRDFLKRHEGFLLKAYKCPRGFWTWGCGCRIMDSLLCEALDAGVEFRLTRDQAEALLTAALERAIRDAKDLFPDLEQYEPERRTALVSLSFQFGKEGLAGFRQLCRAVRRGDWARAANELRFKNGLTKKEKSDYAVQCPKRCAETAAMLQGRDKCEPKPAGDFA